MNGGASNEAGGEHRAGLAAYLAAMGLTGRSMTEADSGKVPTALDFETNDPVDDLRCTMEDRSRWYIQAKLTGKLGKPFDDTMRQWAQQRLADGDELVMGVAVLSKTLEAAQAVLEYDRTSRGVNPNTHARQQLKTVMDVAGSVDAALPKKILAHGRFFRCDTGDGGTGRSIASAWLEAVTGAGHGTAAFDALVRRFQQAGRRQERTDVTDWVAALEAAGHPVTGSRDGTSAQRQALRQQTVNAYRSELTARTDRLDLSSLVPGVGDITVTDLLMSWKLNRPQFPTEQQVSSEDVAIVARRQTRLLIEGLPGMGKTTMMSQLAAYWAADADAPLPVPVRFGSIAQAITVAGDVSLALLSRLAADQVSSAQHADVIEAITAAALAGRVAFLIDGLDETYGKLGAVLSGLSRLMVTLPDATGWVITSRPAAARNVGDALRFERTELRHDRDSGSAVRAILEHQAGVQKIPDEQRNRWIRERSHWHEEQPFGRRRDSLLATPMHVALLTLHVALHDSVPTSPLKLLPLALEERAAEPDPSSTAGAPPGGWDHDYRPGMALQVIIAVGHHLAGRDTDSREHLTNIAAESLQTWGFSSPVTRNVAKQLLWFWDERAAVLHTDGESIRARSRRWIDVADAMWLAEHADDGDTVRDWVGALLAVEGSREALVFAAHSVPAVVDALLVRASGDVDSVLAAQALIAWSDEQMVDIDIDLGARLQQALFHAMAHAQPGPSGRRWKAPNTLRADGIALAAAALPVSPEARAAREVSLSGIGWDDDSRRVVAGITAVADAQADGIALLPQPARDLMATLELPTSKPTTSTRNRRTGVLEIGSSTTEPVPAGLGMFAHMVARLPVDLTEEQATWLFLAAGRGPANTYFSIVGALESRGFRNPRPLMTTDIFRALANAVAPLVALDWLLVPLTSEGSVSSPLPPWRMQNLADLTHALFDTEVAATDSALVVVASDAERRDWFDLMMAATGLDPVEVVREAMYARSAAFGTEVGLAFLLCPRVNAPSADPTKLSEEQWERVEALLCSQVEWIGDSALDLVLRGGRAVRFPSDSDAVASLSPAAALNFTVGALNAARDLPAAIAEHLANNRPAVRRGAALVARQMRSVDGVAELVQKCCDDEDWSVRVAAGATQVQAESATYWCCPECEFQNSGIEAWPCGGCRRDSRPGVLTRPRNPAF
ncbi:NACHT domain-containing protein [Curtobacterium sp. WHRI 8282]|uniref:NACHT domain-containing protein n=1 Tax=Curtobacterium sp. WHRI 8282 TaxID=3162559 RepID=UPI0032EF6428